MPLPSAWKLVLDIFSYSSIWWMNNSLCLIEERFTFAALMNSSRVYSGKKWLLLIFNSSFVLRQGETMVY